MPKFSIKSKQRLYTCDPQLRKVLDFVIQFYDITILKGIREKEEQDQAFAQGHSKVKWPDSKHNVVPPRIYSKAVDLAPYPFNHGNPTREDIERFMFIAGFILGVAESMGVKLRWGGDWNGDFQFTEDFQDLFHFELIDLPNL